MHDSDCRTLGACGAEIQVQRKGVVSMNERGGEWFHGRAPAAEFWDREQLPNYSLNEDRLGLGKLSCALEGHLSPYKK